MSQPSVLKYEPSFGYGDRIGLATPGHLEAHRRSSGAILPIFAQQSIREMTRTVRTPEDVMSSAASALDAAGFDGAWGADADHLKTPEDVTATAEAGFLFFTIDPSDGVDQKADHYDADRVEANLEPCPWIEQYTGRTIDIPDGPSIEFDALTVKRAAVKYGRAIRHALSLADHIRAESARLGREHEIEISVDESEQPTSLAEHYIFAEQLLTHGVNLVSLAPRWIGELEKGVDYIGSVSALEASIADHAAIARYLGEYKLSLHSGSDKLSIYEAFARATRGRFHVKTAGTSYLEALRVAARHHPDLFRRVIAFSRDCYERDRATYHVHATLDDAPPASADVDLVTLETRYLQRWADVPAGKGFTEAGRQILHCAFGSVLSHPELKGELLQVLREHPETHVEILAEHFGRHLRALEDGLATV
ncbi:MAG: tagaturonate epimerase family protein [Planctomycetota bacterium]